MSITATFTNDTISFGWTTNNQSDSWAADVSNTITRKLGAPDVVTQSTQSYATTGNTRHHMGTWVTTPSPEQIDLPNDASFAFTQFHGYQSSNTLNTYIYYKVSVVVENPGDPGNLIYDRTLIPWSQCPHELDNNAGSSWPMGDNTQNHVTNFEHLTSGETILVDEMIAIEIGYDVTAGASGNVYFEYGDMHNDHDSLALSASSRAQEPE